LRSISLVDWITSLVQPIQVVISANVPYDEETRRRAMYNGQKIVLQDALNVIFGQVPNTIYIETNLTLVAIEYIYTEPEAPLIAYTYKEAEVTNPFFSFTEAEAAGAGSYDFIVFVPVGIFTTELERRIRSEVSRYKLAGKTFTIQTY
jgi:hypothetical protein